MRLLAAFALLVSAPSSDAAVLTFSIFNRTPNEVRLVYSDGSKSGSVSIEAGFESVVAIECAPKTVFTSIQTRSHEFDLGMFDQKQLGLIWFVVKAEDRVDVFPFARVQEPDAEKLIIDRPDEPPIVMRGEAIKRAEPGATDNPDDAQRFREDN